MANHSSAAWCRAGVALLVAFHCGPAGQAYASVCSPPSVEEFLVVDQWNLMTANIDAEGLHSVGDVEQSYRARLWHRRQGDHAHVMRFSHDYRAYEIETSPDRALQTNGHLHRLAWSYRFTGPSWEVSVAPVLAASSNASRHPRAIDAEFIFWQGLVRQRRAWSPSIEGFWGLCRDDRFGDARLAPVLGIDWRVNDNLELTLGYPDMRLHWRLHPRLRLQTGIRPAGGRWRVYDDALVRRSLFAMESWRFSLEVALQVTRAHELIIGGGREVRREFAFRLEDGTDLRRRARDTTFTGIRWRWLR